MEVHQCLVKKQKSRSEESVRRENREKEKLTKRQEAVNKLIVTDISIGVWQDSIFFGSTKKPQDIKSILDQTGVIVIRNFVGEDAADVWNGCIQVAKSSKDSLGLHVAPISGNQIMFNLNVDVLLQQPEFSFVTNVLTKLNLEIKKIIGNDFSLMGDISILETPNGAQKQFAHADNILRNRYNGLLVLSENAPPPLFLPKSAPDVPLFISPAIDRASGQLIRVEDREMIQRKFALLFGNVQELEKQMFPVSRKRLQKGDLVLFEADMVHRGDICTYHKTLLFFHCRPGVPESQRVDNDVQFHVGLLGSLVYGILPVPGQERDAYFRLIRAHDESLPNSKVTLPQLLGDKVSKAYKLWLSRQPTSFAV
jgi:hypothetical protein